MCEQIMTPEQLQGLHDDIRDGYSMIVACDHYRNLEADIKRLDEENAKLHEVWVAAVLCLKPPDDCNDVAVLKAYMKEVIKKNRCL